MLKYDDVLNDQRKVVFEQRATIIDQHDVSGTVRDMRVKVVTDLLTAHIAADAPAHMWRTPELAQEVERIFGLDLPLASWCEKPGTKAIDVEQQLAREVERRVEKKEREFGGDTMRYVEKMILLQNLDHLWREHLATLEHLRQVVGFRGYGQRDPLNEFKTEGFHLFEGMLSQLREAVIQQLMHIQAPPSEPEELPLMHRYHADPPPVGQARVSGDAALADLVEIQSLGGRLARNAPCPCDSGKKFKHCHGKY